MRFGNGDELQKTHNVLRINPNSIRSRVLRVLVL
jgi:hypothetical protein